MKRILILLVAFLFMLPVSIYAGDGAFRIVGGVAAEYTPEGITLKPLYGGHLGVAARLMAGEWGQLFGVGEFEYMTNDSLSQKGGNIELVYYPSMYLKDYGMNIGFILGGDVSWLDYEPNAVAYVTGASGVVLRYAVSPKIALYLPIKAGIGDKYNSVTSGLLFGYTF